MTELVCQPIDTVVRCGKVLVPDGLRRVLDGLYPLALEAARGMLKHRDLNSSKHWKTIPCVVSKTLIDKYQKNRKCKEIRNLAIPICGDKGRQIKFVEGGIRIPALFKKAVFPVRFPLPVEGHVRQVEFFRREGRWFASVCYNTPRKKEVQSLGVVGVDRNSVGNIAVMADLQTGKVFKLGPNPAKTKEVFRNRRKNLQKEGKKRLLKKVKRKQSRRMTYENHRASRTIVDYAASHRLAIVLEDLGSVRKKGSRIRRYSERNQWAFAQLETFIRYKAALRGVPVHLVDPAYTSKRCSRCGSIHEANGKHYRRGTCGHNDHRDVNAAFNIARKGMESLAVRSGPGLSVSGSGPVGGPQAGKEQVA